MVSAAVGIKGEDANSSLLEIRYLSLYRESRNKLVDLMPGFKQVTQKLHFYS